MKPFEVKFKLIVPVNELKKWAERRDDKLNGGSKKLELEIEDNIIPRVKKQGYLNKQDFLTVCRWKSPRPAKHHEQNSDSLIKQVTQIALDPNTCEELKIKILTTLNGVNMPVASVFLHFFDKNYPILDFRALWSLGVNKPPTVYQYKFWQEYVEYLRTLAKANQITMRELDKALWQYSREHQASQAV